MKECPQCFSIIEVADNSEVLTLLCTNCGTRSVNFEALQKHFQSPNWDRIIEKRYSGRKSEKKHCARRNCHLLAFDVSAGAGTVEVDVCHKCEQVWLDMNELTRLSEAAGIEIDQQLNQEQESLLSEIEVEDGKAVPQHMNFKITKKDFGVRTWKSVAHLRWRLLLALLGVPIENQNRLKHTPWMTYFILAAITVFSVFTFHFRPENITEFGFKPTDPWRLGGLTYLTAFFLHGDYGHLIGNFYMLLIFGDNVEDRLGWKYLILVIGGTLVGTLFHALWTVRPEATLVGASTGLSALIAYYAFTFPRTKFWMLLALFFWIGVPVWAYVFFWIGLQLVGQFMFEGISGVSYLGHLGGLAVGLTFWFLEKNVKKLTPRAARV